MSEKTAQVVTTPVGDLEWVFITGKGKKDLNDNDRYVADVVMDKEKAQPFIDEIEAFWDEFKPKKHKGAPKSLGWKEIEDDAGESTGRIRLSFWTGTTFPDGSQKIVKVFNAKGAEVSLGDKKIGNGSRGRIKGAMDIYDSGPGARGVTLYLNGIQLSKFVPFEGGVNFDEIEDDEGGDFDGFDDGMGGIEEDNSEDNSKATPRL